MIGGKDILLKKDREIMSKPIRVESKNTGRIWGFDTDDEVKSFMFGRNRKWYRIFNLIVKS